MPGKGKMDAGSGKSRPSAMERVYSRICREKVSPPVEPDPSVLSGLAKGQLRLRMDPSRGDHGCPAIARFLASKAAAHFLEAIDIVYEGGAGPSADGVLEVVRAAGREIGKCLVLKTLSVRGAPLTLRECRVLASGVSQHGVLESVTVGGWRVPPEGVALLLRSLADTSTTAISLPACGLADASVPLVAHLLRCHAARRDEALWSASLRGRHVQRGHSADGLSPVSRTGCLLLDLGHNDIGDRGAAALASALSGDSWLLGLNLDGNARMTDTACDGIAKALRCNMDSAVLALRMSATAATPAALGRLQRSMPSAERSLLAALALVPDGAAGADADEVLRCLKDWRSGKATLRDANLWQSAARPFGRRASPARRTPSKATLPARPSPAAKRRAKASAAANGAAPVASPARQSSSPSPPQVPSSATSSSSSTAASSAAGGSVRGREAPKKYRKAARSASPRVGRAAAAAAAAGARRGRRGNASRSPGRRSAPRDGRSLEEMRRKIQRMAAQLKRLESQVKGSGGGARGASRERDITEAIRSAISLRLQDIWGL